MRFRSRASNIEVVTLFVFVQFVCIVSLLLFLSNEYQANAFMRNWISHNFPLLAFVLNGYLAAIMTGALIGVTILLIKNIES